MQARTLDGASTVKTNHRLVGDERPLGYIGSELTYHASALVASGASLRERAQPDTIWVSRAKSAEMMAAATPYTMVILLSAHL
jgi:hypothetical protein